MNTIPLRHSVPVETTWDTSSLFATPTEWETALTEIETLLPQVTVFQGRFSEGPQTLTSYFRASESLQQKLDKVGLYARLNYSVDTTDTEAGARDERIRGVMARVQAALAFAEPEMLTVGVATLKEWARTEPSLSDYSHYFDRLEKRIPHIRSGEVEALLKQLSDPFGGVRIIHSALTDTDLTFTPALDKESNPQEIGQGTIGSLLGSQDTKLRQTAWKNYADAHLANRNTLANAYITGVKQNIFMARARGYASAKHAALEANFIPVSVFDNLLTTYQKHLPLWHRYWNLRQKALKTDTLNLWDVRAPLQNTTPPVTYAQAVEWIAQGMAPLGSEYTGALRQGALSDRWVDYACNKGKRMGAFSSGSQGTFPFILMIWSDTIYSLSTLAHELGHSLHSYYTWKNQPYINSRYGLFVAEVASNFNQALTRAYLLEKFKGDPTFEITILEEAMANFYRYFFIMPTLARFEEEVHAQIESGKAVTATTLIQHMAELFLEGYGPALTPLSTEETEQLGSTWMQFSTHLYANFYPYQYATGIAGAHALTQKVLTEGEPAARAYRDFLSAGGSLYPLDALQLAGVDLATPAAVETTFAVMEGYITRLEELLT